MVRVIKRQTYECFLCKKIYTSKRKALGCEENCLDDKNFIFIPTRATMKINGERHKILLARRVRRMENE